MEIASAGRLNIIADVPLSPIASFSVKSAVNGDEILSTLAEHCGVEAHDYHGTWCLVPHGEKGRLIGKNTTILRSHYGIFEDFSQKLSCISSYPVRIWSDLSRNILVMFGFRDDMNEVHRQFLSMDVPKDFIQLSLQVKSIGDSSVIASLSVITLNNRPVTFSLAPNAFEALNARGTVTAHFEKNGGSIYLNSSISFSIPSSGMKCESIEASQTKSGVLVSKVVKLGAKMLSLEMTPIFIPMKDFEHPLLDVIGSESSKDHSQDHSKSHEKAAGSGGSVSSDSDPDALKNLTYLDRPLSEVFEFVASASSGSLVCAQACREPITLILRGPGIYYEELMRLLASIRGLAIRKVGNCWIVGNKYVLAKRECIDRGCIIFSKYLSYNDSESFTRMVNEMSARLGLSEKMSADPRINSVFISWDGLISAECVRDLIDILDRPPTLFGLNVIIQTSGERVKQIASAPENIPYMIRLNKLQEVSRFEVVPFVFGCKGYAGAKVDFELLNTGWGKTAIEAFTPFGPAPDRLMIHLENPAEAKLYFGGIGSPTYEAKADDSLVSDIISSDSASMASTTSTTSTTNKDAFDHAFDSSF
ncbi:MAG: hypothetical protein HQM09_11275 [Candidatus Riflebacteria bacterium]|nr:hypothetical protein [Candidatus Riflebacteria bacterium]